MSWVKPIGVGTITAVLGTVSTYWLKSVPILWVGVVLFFVCTASALVGGWLIGKAKATRLGKFRDVLAQLNQRHQALLQDQAKSTMETYVSEFFDLLCEKPTLAHLHAGVIFLLDRDDNNWLVASGFSAKKGKSKKRFFVGDQKPDGNEPGAPGAAGIAFIERRSLIVRFDGNGRADHPMYQKFQLKPTTTYRSFVVSPIRWNGHSVGVLSLESHKKHAFPKDEAAWYEAFADDVGNALYHFGELEEAPPSTKTPA